MGLSVFDCQICGRSPYLESGEDSREVILVENEKYVICQECKNFLDKEATFRNPSRKDTMSKEDFKELIILIRRKRKDSFMIHHGGDL